MYCQNLYDHTLCIIILFCFHVIRTCISLLIIVLLDHLKLMPGTSYPKAIGGVFQSTID